VGQWTRRHSSLTSDILTPASATNTVDCPAFKVPPTTQRISVTLNEVVFEGDEVWTPGSP
jgi:hypothetical protein